MFKTGAIVPWVSYLFPTEILSSYGITPMIPEIGSATITGSDLRDAVEAASARMPLARDVCSYHRTALAAVENDMLPVPTMCLGTTPLCLGKEMLLEMLAIKHNVPFREIRVPLPPDEGEAAPEVVADVAEQIRVLHEDIGRWTGRSPNLRKAMELSNRASKAWGELNAARLAGDAGDGRPQDLRPGVPRPTPLGDRSRSQGFRAAADRARPPGPHGPGLRRGPQAQAASLAAHRPPSRPASSSTSSRSGAPW